MKRYKLAIRLIISFSILIALMFMGTALSLRQINAIRIQDQRMHQVDLQVLSLMRIYSNVILMDGSHSLSKYQQDLLHQEEKDVMARQAQALRNMKHAHEQAEWMLVVTGLATLLSATLLGYMVIRSITGPLKILDEGAKALSRGEFHPIAVTGDDELANLGKAFNFASSELRKLYEEIRHSEAYFRSLIENASDIIMVHSPDGTIIYGSPSIKRVLGYEQQEMVGRNSLEFIHPDDAQKAMNLFRGAAEGSAVMSAELRFLHKNGEWRFIESVSHGLKSGFTTPGIVVNSRDITYRKRVEEALRKNEWFLEKAQEVAHVGSWISDPETTGKLHWSKEVYRIFGVSDRDFDGKVETFFNFVHPDDRDAVSRASLDALAGIRQYDIEHRIVRPDGIVRWVRETADILRDEKGNPQQMVGVVLDITELKNAREALQRTNEELEKKVRERTKDLKRLAAAVEQAGDGILLISPELVIVYANPAYEKLTGYWRHELIGNRIDVLRDYFSYPDFEGKILQMKDMVNSGVNAYSGIFKRKRRNGEIIDVNLSISAVHDETGNIMNYVAVVREITEEIRLQQQLFQSQKQESIGTLAGGIAHDLKNTFTPILLNTEMLIEDMGAESPEYPLLDEISKATRHGVDLVNQILTFSRRAPQKKATIAISPVIRETLSLLRATLPSTIEIRSRIHAENAFVYAEPVQIRQLLINLGSNAGYAMRDQGGFLDVDLSSVILDEKSAAEISRIISRKISAGPYVRITVTDTGKGMDEETRKRIFDPFFTTKKPGEGTGMGLSVVQGIMKNHQGAITVQSEPGKGSTFTILLPMLADKINERGYADT